MTRDPSPPPEGRGPDPADRGPVETLAPSRTALVLVGVAAITIAVLAGVGVMNVSGRNLDDAEELLAPGSHTLEAGPARVTADLDGPWVRRHRCERWVQLSDADDDATTLHVVWLDAVPLPSDAPEIRLVATPDDLVGWWREQLDLQVTPLAEGEVDGHPMSRHGLDETSDSRRLDGLVACGEVGGPAGLGMYGPAARFDQQVAIIDVDGTTLLVVAAAYAGGDIERAVSALEELLATAEVSAGG